MLPNLTTICPQSPEDLVRLVSEALANQTPLYAYGGRSKQHVGRWPSQPTAGLAVAMNGLDRVVAHEPGDMVVSVQAGVRLADLQRQLAAHGQWLPIDAGHEHASLGGILATDASGPRRQGYGTLKDQLLGMHVLGPRGQITKSGGRVVKNVAGFDLHRLHVGAFGSLGLIVEATLKVSTLPSLRSAYALAFPNQVQAHSWLLSIFASPLRPTALELLTGDEAKRVAAHLPALRDAPALALVGFEGSAAFVERHQRDIERLIPGDRSHTLLPDAQSLWQNYSQHLHGPTSPLVVRVGAKPHALPALLANLPPHIDTRASVGLGLGRLVWKTFQQAAQVETFTRQLHERAQQQGGYAVVESAPLELPDRATLPFGPPTHAASPIQNLSSRLKQTWDPNHLMHPGRAPG